jgi:hypothetical protein
MSFDPVSVLYEELTTLGVAATVTGQGVLIPEAGLLLKPSMAVSTQGNSSFSHAWLDVAAESDRIAGAPFLEKYAGWGHDGEDEVARRAFGEFLNGALKVILAAFVDPSLGTGEVEWEDWNFGERSWRVCVGPRLVNGTMPEASLCAVLHDRLKQALLPLLKDGPHRLRIYYWLINEDRMGSKPLLDGVAWPEGQAIIEAWRPDGKYAVDQLLIALPD